MSPIDAKSVGTPDRAGLTRRPRVFGFYDDMPE